MKISKYIYVTFIFTIINLPFVKAQNIITVNDKLTRLPIFNVLIFNSAEEIVSIQTNEKGIAPLENFSSSDLFNFQHAAYENATYTFTELAKNNFTIFLTERIIPIGELTVSASKWEQDKTEVASEILTLTSKNVSFGNPPTSADLLAGSGEIFVQKSQLGGGSPLLRGFAANSVLLVVDGVRLNNAIYRSGNLQNIINIDPNALESTEVLFGPGSVIYGSDALGGVMDFHTIQPKLSSSKKRYIRGSAFTRYSSAANEKTGHFHFEFGKKNISLFSSVTYTDFDDLKTGSNRTDEFPDFGTRPFFIRRINGEDQLVANENENLQVDSGYTLYNFINKVRLRPTKNLDLEYAFYLSNTSDIPRYDRLIQTNTDGSLRNAEWYYGPQRWEMHRLSLNSYGQSSLYDQLKVTAAFQDYTESRNDRRFGNTSLRNQTEQVDIFSINFDFDKKIGKGSLFYGAEWVFNKVNSTATRTDIETNITTPTSTRYPDLGSSYQSVSAYGSYKYKFSEKWILNSGLRFSSVSLDAETSDPDAFFLENNTIDLRNGAVNGTLGIVWKQNETSTFSGLISSGFRSPNIDDVGKVFELDGDEIVVPNANLKPEFSYNAELSFQKRLYEKLTIDFVAYHSWLVNAITRGQFEINGSPTLDINGETFQVFAQRNFSNARIYGFSSKITYQLNQYLAFKSNVTVTRGKETETNSPLRHVPPTFGRFSAVYRKDRLKLEGYTEFSGPRKFEDLAPSEVGKVDLYTADGSLAWYTLNLKGSYQLNRILLLNGGVENLLDTHYRTYSSGISAPGRNFIISLSAKF